MSLPDNGEPNPYQSPLADIKGPGNFAGPIPDPLMVKKFRQQTHALGAYWIFCGLVPLVLVVIFLTGNRGAITVLGGNNAPGSGPVILAFAVMLLLIGGCFAAVGVLSCLKQMWAVYAGLALSYLALVIQLLSLNVCSIVILIIVILQAHRVIGWARQMRAAGVPLTAKP